MNFVTPVTPAVTSAPNTSVCQCCGHPLRVEFSVNGVAMFLRGKHRQLFVIVEKAGQAGIEVSALHHRMYGNEPGGGPQLGIIYVLVSKINQRLAHAGLAIRNVDRSGFYKLVRL